MLGAASNISQQINRKAVNRRSGHIPRAGSCLHAFSPRLRMFSCNSSCDLNGDNEDVTISANDGRASSCNMSVSRLMRRRDDTKVCTDPPARVTNNRRDQAIRPSYYGDHFFSRPRCSYLMLGGASRHDRRVGHAATRWDVQTATRADSIRRWGKPPRGPTQFIWPVVARHDLDQFLPFISAIRSASGPSCSPHMRW